MITWSCSRSYAVWKFVHLSHDLLPRLVYLCEHLSLIWQLSLNVWRTEDALQVQPVALTLQPLILHVHTIHIHKRDLYVGYEYM